MEGILGLLAFASDMDSINSDSINAANVLGLLPTRRLVGFLKRYGVAVPGWQLSRGTDILTVGLAAKASLAGA